MAVVSHNACDPWAYFVDECERYETKIVAGRFKEDHLVVDRRGLWTKFLFERYLFDE